MAKSFKTAKTIKLFLDECKEYLTTLDQDLVDLEGGNTDEELMKRVSRNVHTLKGSSAMLEFMDISEISHAIEDVMEKLKKKFPDVDKSLMDEIFEKVDRIKDRILAIENGTYDDGGAAPPAPKPTPPEPPPTPQPEKPAPPAAPEPAPAPAPEKKEPTPPPPPPPPAEKAESKPASTTKGRTNLFEVAGREISASLDRCMAVIADAESRFVLADNNAKEKRFFDQFFESAAYLSRSMTCMGEPK